MGSEQQRLVEMLVERTGQPREKVEEWVAGMVKMMEGSLTVYDVSRMVGGFISKHTRNAKPFVLRFGRSLLKSFVEEQRRLAEQQRKQMEVKDTIPQRARSGEGTTKNNSFQTKPRNRTRDTRSTTATAAFRTKKTDTIAIVHNPWAPRAVLLNEPIFIPSYRNKQRNP